MFQLSVFFLILVAVHVWQINSCQTLNGWCWNDIVWQCDPDLSGGSRCR